MMNIAQKETVNGTKPPLFAGIDVGAEELVLVIRKNSKSLNPQTFSNTPSDRTRLVNKLAKLTVCLEARQGVYHFDLSLALHDAGVSLMVLNPKASHNFAKVLMKNSKTDAVDANTLAEYAERMAFVAWTRPSNEKIALRCSTHSFAHQTESRCQEPPARPHCHGRNTQSCAHAGNQPVRKTHRQLIVF
jgi:transposase